MTEHGAIGRTFLQRHAGGRTAFYPSGRRSEMPFFRIIGELCGDVYFFRKEDGRWKFTGAHDYHHD